MSADYLFQQDKHYDVSYDTGDKVIQCGRHNDIFKFWLMWRAKVCKMNNKIFKVANIKFFSKMFCENFEMIFLGHGINFSY